MPNSKEVVWNGVSSLDIPGFVIGKVTRRLIGEPRGTLRTVPGREGAWFFPEKRGMRQITMECFVEVDSYPTERRDAITAVADWYDVELQGRLVISDEPDVYYDAVVAETPDPDEWRETGVFDLSFLVQPYSNDLDTSTHVATGDNAFTDSWDPDLVVPVYPVIEITPTTGTLDGFELSWNGETIIWAGTCPEGSTVTINSISAVVLLGESGDSMLVGAYDAAELAMAGVYGKFPTLLPGTNGMIFERTAGTATAVTIQTTYRKRYRK